MAGMLIGFSLTLALMGSDDLNLRVLSQSSDDEKERKSAAKVLRLLERGRHWVLVVLLLSNVVSHFTASSIAQHQKESRATGRAQTLLCTAFS